MIFHDAHAHLVKTMSPLLTVPKLLDLPMESKHPRQKGSSNFQFLVFTRRNRSVDVDGIHFSQLLTPRLHKNDGWEYMIYMTVYMCEYKFAHWDTTKSNILDLIRISVDPESIHDEVGLKKATNQSGRNTKQII